ncbi:MAG: clp protease binding subunit [Patescibacteria group bacterium]|nr:clp protease binding subunit [Patescibacteria group bacterium]
MNHYSFNPHALRVAKAKIATGLGPAIERILQITAILLLVSAAALIATGHHQGFSLGGLMIMLLTSFLWLHRDLDHLPPVAVGSTTALDQLLPPKLTAVYRPTMTATELWNMLTGNWETGFLMLRFALKPETITPNLAGWQLNHDELWAEVERLCQANNQTHVSAAVIVCAFFTLNPQLAAQLTTAKLTPEDLGEGARWLARLDAYEHAVRPLYGGIARDWAAGFTPLLARFGTNLSHEVEYAGQHLSIRERTNQLDALVTGLNNGGGSVILVGEPGIGKSALLLGLADRLLQGIESGGLKHHQIMSLSASVILSSAQGPGDIENIVLGLFDEAVRAGNIVVALDEAQLFFGEGTGAVNLSQILLPILQQRSLKLVLAVTPGDWQRLKATNTAMASLLTPLVLAEPTEIEVMRELADRALTLERDHITTWSALLEAYRLSGRYLDDEAYPGRALKLLEAACNFPDGSFISERSVQQAVESQFGVKVQQASGAESDVLLHLEDKIHERMINQTRAVSVIANALRRARAGVANPRRPIGSFLFLGPTGVGKTELAKSIAALYFGAEDSIIRLDMSEYQQVADVDRILESAAQNPAGFLPRVHQNPFTVVLFDEIEKAHPNILNLLLQLLDEGNLTDLENRPTSFKDAIIIATSNAGSDEIREHIEAGEELENFEEQFTNDLISSGAFRPELLNRFDEIVLFRPLKPEELGQVVKLMITEVNKTLANQKINVTLTEDAVAQLVEAGYDPRLGARPMRRMVQRRVEDAVAGMILRGDAKPGDTITLDAEHLAGSPPPSDTPA